MRLLPHSRLWEGQTLRGTVLRRVGPQADQHRAEEAMSAGSEWIEASIGSRFGSCETHPKNPSGRQKENRGCRTCTLGDVQSGEEERGVKCDARLKHATSVAGFSPSWMKLLRLECQMSEAIVAAALGHVGGSASVPAAVAAFAARWDAESWAQVGAKRANFSASTWSLLRSL